MKKITLLSLLAVAVLAVPGIALACGDGVKNTIAMVTVQDVAKWNKEHKVTPVDANGAETRTKMGVVPGAKLLTSSSQFAAAELPAAKDSKLVFYCANTRCQASHQAANRALELGYTDVSVMPDGIKGWVDAGQKTDKSTPRS